MKLKNVFFALSVLLGFLGSAQAAESLAIGVVNFATCVQNSKYGKHEQEQLENLRKQWSSLIEETEKELKALSAKFEDQNYMDGLSPQAEEELKTKYRTLNEDMTKYQNQLYHILNQANYHFIQKLSAAIATASEAVSEKNKLEMVLNKEACFSFKPSLEITDLVLKEMDKNFDKDVKEKKISQNVESLPKISEKATKNISAAKEEMKKETQKSENLSKKAASKKK